MFAIVIAIIVLVGGIILKGSQMSKSASRKLVLTEPVTPKDNDKIIVVKNVTHADIKDTLTNFCEQYNQKDLAASPRLWQVSPNTYAVTFPYDVEFQTFCFAVNFLKYPMNISWNVNVRAWATAKPGDTWITEKSVNKKVMLFLAVDDNEYDNVFLTTEDNIGYKLDFAFSHAKQPLSAPKEKYIAPTITFDELNNHQFEDFR